MDHIKSFIVLISNWKGGPFLGARRDISDSGGGWSRLLLIWSKI